MDIRVITTLQELETVRDYWERWQNHVSNDFAQFKLVCLLRPEIESPFVIVIGRQNQPRALLIGRLESTKFAPAIGYLKPMKVPTKVITILPQGLLGHFDEDITRESVEYLWSLLDSGVADAIEFYSLSEHSTLLKTLLKYGNGWFCEKKPRWSIHRNMALPVYGEFIEHKIRSKHRTAIKRKQRELESAFPGKVSWRWMSSFDDLPGICAQLEEVAACTYQRGLGAGFFNNEEFCERLHLFAQRGQLRMQLLEINDKVRAFWYGVVYQDVFHSSETGYDPDLGRYEVGTLIFIRMVNELMRENIQMFDFGLGDAHYKQRFGDQSWKETTIWLFAPTVKGLALRSMLRLFIIMDSGARQVLQKMRLTDRLKTMWRKKVAKGGS